MNVRDGCSRSERLPAGSGNPLDELFDVLCHPVRRRIVLELVRSAPGTTFAPGDLHDDDAGEYDRIALHHNHLPKLAAAGYVEWEPGTDAVTRGPRFGTVAPVVDLLTEYGDRLPGAWSPEK